MKKLLLILLSAALLSGSLFAILIVRNNTAAPWPEQAQLERAYTASLGWLAQHEDKILQISNPVLWRMIQHSAEISQDPFLIELFQRYHDTYLASRRWYWLPLFFPGRWTPLNDSQLSGLDDYQLYFVYAITCDQELSAKPRVLAQMDPDYCSGQPWRLACPTHQLMAFRFMQRSQCNDGPELQTAITALQSRIRLHQTLDPRVVDVYIQRVLMLVESGARASVKPIWIQHILDAQLSDGGWGNFAPLLTLGADRYLGFDRLALAVKTPDSNFHATAQGVLLLSLLLNPQTE